MIPNHNESEPVQRMYSGLSQEERLELTLLLLKDLKPLKKMSDEAGFEFLSYLLGMAELEVQSIASGPGEPEISICEVCGFSYDANPQSEVGDVSHKHIC